MKPIAYRHSISAAVLLSLCALGAALLPVLNADRLAALFGANDHLRAVFAQLRHAHLKPPFLLLLPGAALLSLTLHKAFRARGRLRILSLCLTACVWLILLTVCFLMLEVNRVPMHSALTILIDWIKGGVLDAL